MGAIEEAKEIAKKAGCKKAFAVYDMKLDGITEVRDYNKEEEYIELEKDVDKLVSVIEKKLTLDQEKPLIFPLNDSMNKYLEVYWKNKKINP